MIQAHINPPQSIITLTTALSATSKVVTACVTAPMIQAHINPPQSIITETTALSATFRACTSPYPTVVNVVSVKYKHIKYWICGFCTSHGTGNPLGENHSSSSAFAFRSSGSKNGAIHELRSLPI